VISLGFVACSTRSVIGSFMATSSGQRLSLMGRDMTDAPTSSPPHSGP
jgi:hypothetical protein